MMDYLQDLMRRTLSCVIGIGLGRITMEEGEPLNLSEPGMLVISMLLIYSSINEAIN